MSDLEDALECLARLGVGPALTESIGVLERALSGLTRADAEAQAIAAGFSHEVMVAALMIKAVAGQINVVVHAVGIVTALPYILEADERIESLSLGAGNTGRAHDLETDRQIAEFKFIEWRGGAESIRQNGLFVDLFNLASAHTAKRRVMYVVGKEQPVRFLNNQRAIASVLSKNRAVEHKFRETHGDSYRTVREYWRAVHDLVEIVDLRDVVPHLQSQTAFELDPAMHASGRSL
jgi:hypothetical protein